MYNCGELSLEIDGIDPDLIGRGFDRAEPISDTDEAQKARKRVCKTITDAYDEIHENHRALADYLRDSIDLGWNCHYQPRTNVDWETGT